MRSENLVSGSKRRDQKRKRHRSYERIANHSYLRSTTEYLLRLRANGIDVFFEIVVSSPSFDPLFVYGKCDQRNDPRRRKSILVWLLFEIELVRQLIDRASD